MQRFDGKRVWITGAAGGIGQATAARLAAEGARVWCVDRPGSGVAEWARPHGHGASEIDVSDEAATAASLRAAAEAMGGLDVIVANAGTEGRVAPLVAVERADFARTLEVNVIGVFLAIKHGAPLLLAAGGGAIVATSSVAGFIGSPGMGPYIASKHAVLGLVKTAAAELGPQRIRVNAVCPGPIENRMMRSIEEQAAPGAGAAVKAGFEKLVPLGRYGTNEEIAAAIAFLASPDASYCNGAALLADGGFVAI